MSAFWTSRHTNALEIIDIMCVMHVTMLCIRVLILRSSQCVNVEYDIVITENSQSCPRRVSNTRYRNVAIAVASTAYIQANYHQQ